MIRIKLSTNSPNWPFLRQTPGGEGIWGDCQFFVDEDIDECNFWVVYDDILHPETTRCPPGHTLLITGEPPSVRTYPTRFINQFAAVLTCHPDMKHPNVIQGQQALPWMVGCRYFSATGQWDRTYSKDYDELSAMPAVPKTKLLSVLASNKKITPGHEHRLVFVEALRQHFGTEVDVFGRGIRPVEDKWDAIAPYKYHVVIENGEFPDYWTEKLSDTLLAGAYPLYAGCPNIEAYFPKNTLTQFSTRATEQGLQLIARAIHSDRYAASVQERDAAKDWVLNRYNLFAVIAEMAHTPSHAAPAQALRIQPSSAFGGTPLSKITSKVRQWITS